MNNNNNNNNDNTNQHCWICMKKINDYMLLPYEDEYLDDIISIFKNTFIIKEIYNNELSNKPIFKFLYYTCCNNCLNNYLKIHNKKFKLIKNREINGKMK